MFTTIKKVYKQTNNRVEIYLQSVWQKCWQKMGKLLWNGSIWTLMATNIYDHMTGHFGRYIAISKRAAAGKPMTVRNSRGPIEHG